MRVWRYMLIVAALALLGCEEANNNIPDNSDGPNDVEVEEPAFEVEFKHIGWYDIEAEITPPHYMDYCFTHTYSGISARFDTKCRVDWQEILWHRYSRTRL